MADLINQAHSAIDKIEQQAKNGMQLEPGDQIAIAQVKVLLSIAMVLHERLPNTAPEVEPFQPDITPPPGPGWGLQQ